MHSIKKTPEEEEEIDLARLQLQLREMEVKATFEQTESEKRRLTDSLSSIKQENRTLQKVLDAHKLGDALADGAAYQRKQKSILHQKLHSHRKQYDALKYENDHMEDDIFKTTDKLMDLDAEAEPMLQDDSSITQKIRMLENRLDKSLIKHNEAMAIRRMYETIVKRLRLERVGFDNQLSAIERTLKAKGQDYTELKNMEHDAQHAKELKKAELQAFKVAYAEARREKKKELEKRKKYVTDRLEAAKKHEIEMKERQRREEEEEEKRLEQEESRTKMAAQTHSTVELRTQEEEERFRQHAEQYRRIQEVTRAKTVEEVSAKFLAQEEMHMQLMVMKADVEAKTEARRDEIAQLRSKNETAKYSGTGQLTSRRILDEFETHYAEAQIQLEKASKNYEQMSHIFSAAKAGVEHLAEKLSAYRPDIVIEGGEVTQKTAAAATATTDQQQQQQSAGSNNNTNTASGQGKEQQQQQQQGNTNAIPSTLDEVIQLCEAKLLLLAEEQEDIEQKHSPERGGTSLVPPSTEMETIMNATLMEMPANNVRVSLQAEYEDGEDGMGGDGYHGGVHGHGGHGGHHGGSGGGAPTDDVDEDLQGREGLKEMSRTAVERENKKRRRRNKHNEE